MLVKEALGGVYMGASSRAFFFAQRKNVMKTNIEAKEHAIKTIQYEEWLKYTVKYIVEGKPEISDGCLLELVDDKYNDVFFYDNSQYKVKQEGEELVKYFTRMNPKGTSRQDIKEFRARLRFFSINIWPCIKTLTGREYGRFKHVLDDENYSL